MRNSVFIANAFFKSWLRSRSGLFFSLVFPVLLLAIFGSIFSNPQNITFNLYVQNKDVDSSGKASQLSSIFIESLNKSGVFKISILSNEVDALNFARSQRGIFEQRRVIVIPKGFNDFIINSTEKAQLEQGISQIQMLLNSPYLNETQKEMLSNFLQYMKNRLQQIKIENVSLEIYISKADPAYEQLINIFNNFISKFGSSVTGISINIPIQEKEIGIRTLSASDYYVPSYIAFTIMSNALFGLTGVISDLRRRGIFKRVIVTPLRKYEWIIGISFSQLILIFLATVIMMAIGYFAFKVTPVIDLIHISVAIFAMILGTLCFTFIGVVIGTLFKQPDTAGTVGSVVAFPLMFLSGVFFPIEIMPSYLKIIAAFSPLYYLAVTLRESMIQGVFILTPISITILAVLSIAFLIISLYLTKWTAE
jgi:ABC-2 type transport system permease protein